MLGLERWLCPATATTFKNAASKRLSRHELGRAALSVEDAATIGKTCSERAGGGIAEARGRQQTKTPDLKLGKSVRLGPHGDAYQSLSQL